MSLTRPLYLQTEKQIRMFAAVVREMPLAEFIASATPADGVPDSPELIEIRRMAEALAALAAIGPENSE